MCRWLNIPRSSYYYKAVKPVSEAELEENIKAIFLESKARYGARKINHRKHSYSLLYHDLAYFTALANFLAKNPKLTRG